MANIIGGVTTTPIAFKTIKENITDQTYSPTSENAQSGKAVAQAIAKLDNTLTQKVDKNLGDYYTKAESNAIFGDFSSRIHSLEDTTKHLNDVYYTKYEINTKIGDIETLLGGI